MKQNRTGFFFCVFFLCVSALFLISCGNQPANQSPPPPPPEQITESKVTFLAVGDILISRGVARAIDRAGTPLAPFQKMEAVFRSTDFNFGNLECPISGRDTVVGKGLVFNMRTKDLAGLKEYNFKVINFANNHAMDQGVNGLRNTHKVLDENGFTRLGTGENLDEAWTPKIYEVKGVKIGFVGASYVSINDGSGQARNDYVARFQDNDRLKKAIDKLKAEGADFIITTMHAGVEYQRRPHQPQIDFAKNSIDYGADMVIGHHPHWIQTFETYKGKYIFYSLGNFIFDQTWSRDTMEGLALRISLQSRQSSIQGNSKTRVEQIELIPVVIENASTPRPANEQETEQILKKIGASEKIIKPQG